jgi:preprotein translocase subunit SecG
MAQFLQTPLTVLHVMACLFLMLVVLVQPGKGGGLGALSGAAATQVFGGRGAGNILTKITWITASTFFVTSITLAYLSSSSDESLAKRAEIAKSKSSPSAGREAASTESSASGAIRATAGRPSSLGLQRRPGARSASVALAKLCVGGVRRPAAL